ncbi:MAG: C39 family peptidase [Elusimicrobia bacterium]|nr:C39 family peptidase [Elusimicrobiota bacterium]
MNLVHFTPLDIEGSRLAGLKALPFEDGLVEGSGELESPELLVPPFDELVGSWNADIPKGASVELRVQARVDGRWSPWYALARWDASTGGRNLGEQKDEFGKVDVDTLVLAKPADAVRYRVVLGQTGRKAPRLHRVALAMSKVAEAPASRPFSPGPWVRELAVRPRSQAVEKEKYRHDICSPTCLSMVLDFWGRRLKTTKVADAVLDQKDPEAKRYGNWPLNIAFASMEGVHGHIARLDGMAGLEREVEGGRPVIVSITFAEGELGGSPMKKTKGHLFVVSGFTPEGDVIVRDPAGPTLDQVRRVYKRADVERVWAVKKRGVAYVLAPRFPQDLVVGVPAADLRRKNRDDAELGSQLVYGERVRALRAKGDWVEVEALEQEAHLPAKEWHPYRGWTKASALRWPPEIPGDAVVRVKRAEARTDDGHPIGLPLGARVDVEVWNGESASVRLLDGRLAEAKAAELRQAGLPPDRGRILQTARQLLGGPYVWGGRSPDGVDCSGLSSLSYRSEGVDLPRDAHEQFLRANPLKRWALKPADLIFLSKPGKKAPITHVMLYAGSDAILESRQSAGKTLETSFRERFGKPLSEIEWGDVVIDVSGPKPEKRTIYFGGYLPQ